MPKIPQYETNEVLHPSDQGIRAYEQLGYHGERAANTIGSNLNAASNEIEEKQAQAQTASMLNDMTSFVAQKHNELRDTLNQTDPGAGVNPMDKFGEGLNTDIDAIGAKYDNPKVQDAFARMKYDVSTRLLDSGQAQWDAITQKHTEQSVNNMRDNLANATYNDPASAEANSKIHDTAIDLAVQSGAISQDQASAAKRNGRETIYNGAAVSALHALAGNPNVSLADVGKLKAVLSSDQFQKNMSPEDYQRVNDSLDKMAGDRTDAGALYLQKSFEASKEQVIKFGDPDGRIGRMASVTARNTPEQLADAAVRVDTYNSWQAEHKVYSDIGNLPQPGVQQYINDRRADLQKASNPAETKAATAALDAAQRLSNERTEQFHKDPASWTIANDDTAGKLYSDYQRNPTPQSFQKYALYATAKQQNLYPGEVPAVLTPDMKRDIQGKMAAVSQDPAGAAQAGQVLGNLRQLTGPYWNEAAHELQKSGIVNGTQFAAAQLIGSPKSWSLAQEGLRAASIPDKILTETSGISKQTADRIASTALSPLLGTFSDTTNGHELVASYVDFVSDVMRSRGKVDSATAQALAQTAVLDRFTIKNNLRIPNDLDANDVADGANNIQSNIHTHNLVVPPSFSGNGPAVQHDAYADDIKDFGHWSTNPRGDGMMLYDQYGAPVYERNKTGQTVQVEVPFGAAANLGRNIRSPFNNAYRVITNPASVGGGSMIYTAPGQPANSFTEK